MNPEQKKGRPQASLSTENRIIRFFARGWTYGRIASKVGVSTSTVWSIVHREPTARRRHDPRLATRVRTWLAHDWTMRRVAAKLGVSVATVFAHAAADVCTKPR